MKPFNLDEYLANSSRKVVTRDGKNVRIFCTDFNNERYPIIVEIQGDENPEIYTKEGSPTCAYDGECTLFPSKDQRVWSKFEMFWDKPKVERFDPKTLQPFDKVLVR